jgi:hypothetical protein
LIAKGSVARGLSVLFVLALVLTDMPLPKAHAAAFFHAAPAASGTEDCWSWANACTLQTALASALSGQEIWVAAGTHLPTTGEKDRAATFLLKTGVAVYGGFAGTEEKRDQRDPAINVTFLSGDIGVVGDSSDNSYHVVTGATGAILDGVTITAGNANGDLPHDRGGGMSNSSSSPQLTNVNFSGNTAGAGGGIYNFNSSPALTNVTLSGNWAGYFGGGMYNDVGSPTITNTIFWGNIADFGGARIFDDHGTPSVSDSVVQGGYAGGANIIADDPKLGALGNYGGWTQTVPLLAGSSAINATSSNCPTTDQRGVPRSQPTCDIGAYEVQSIAYLPLVLRN